MKTAISIDDKIFEEAEMAAKELGLTRSSLYSQAIEEFVRNHMPNIITRKYNEIYKNQKPDKEIDQIAIEMLSKAEW